MKSFTSRFKTPFFRVMSFLMGAVFAAGLVMMFAVKAVDFGGPVAGNAFELGPDADGVGQNANIVDDGFAPPDWAELFIVDPVTGEVTVDEDALDDFGGSAAVFIQDQLSSNSLQGSNDLTGFAKRNKNNDPIQTQAGNNPPWQWDTENHPPKDDLFNVYSYATIVNDELIIYAGLERITNEGASHIDFEYNQAGISLDKEPPCGTDGVPAGDTEPCEFVGDKQEKDLLVVMDFERGGALGSVEIREWDTKGTPDTADDEWVLVSGGVLGEEGCNDDDTVCAFNNHALIDGGPWENRGKNGAVVDELEPNTFTEVGINVTALLEASPCFNSLNAKSRTSPSFNSELKDFALGEFALCQANVATEIHAGSSDDPNHDTTDIQGGSVKVGTPIHDLAIVTGTGVPDVPDPTGTVDFTLYEGLTCEGAVVEEWLDVPLDTGTAGDGISTAESGDFDTLGQPGDYSFSASYSGDTNFPPAALDAEDCEPIMVEQFDSKTVTEIHEKGIHNVDIQGGSVDVLAEIHDFAKVSELNDDSTAPTPTGNVTFKFFSDLTCSAEVNGDVSGTTYPFTTGLDGLGQAETPDLVTAAGPLSFSASYAGDDNFKASTDSACESLTANKLTPTIVTEVHNPSHTDITGDTVKVGTTIHDMAIVSGSGPDPTGTVRFQLFSDLGCQVANGSPVDLGLGNDGVSDGSASVETTPFTPVADTLSYSASYLGDSIYDPAGPALCEPLTVEKFDSKTVTEIHEKGIHTVDIQGGSVDVLTEIHDFAEVSEISDDTSAPTPTGNVTFKFFSDGACTLQVSGDVSGTTYPFTTGLDGLGQAETPDLVTAAGPLSFRANYAGDANYNASTDSACETLTVNKLDTDIVTEIHDPSHVDITGDTVTVGLTIHDKAIVTGSGPDPAGNVSFQLYSDLSCQVENGSAVLVGLVNDGVADGSAAAETTPFTPAAGDLSFSASYQGDANYNPSGPALCEPLTVVGAEGCTPGFWRNHTERWDQNGGDPLLADVAGDDAVSVAVAVAANAFGGIGDGTTAARFRETFNLTVAEMTAAGLNPELTLGDAIALGGGGFNKLARHGVAGLLSAAEPEVAYAFTTTQVLSMVQSAIISGNAEPTASQLASANDEQCPLN
jgi:hypothetical protein